MPDYSRIPGTQIKNLLGKKFGRLTVTEYAFYKNGHTRWHCTCKCGGKITAQSQVLIAGITRSCGCLIRETITTHGLRHHRIYDVWNSMMGRCNNKNLRGYKEYGGRGIKVCKRWSDVRNFIKDMDSSYKKGLSIDRINNDGDYKPSNCRWATNKQQQRNRRISRRVKINGITKHLLDWAEEFNVGTSLIYWRYKKGLRGKDLFKLELRSKLSNLSEK